MATDRKVNLRSWFKWNLATADKNFIWFSAFITYFCTYRGCKMCVYTSMSKPLLLLLRLPSARRYIFLSCSPSMYKSCQVVAMLLWAKMESLLQRSRLHNSAAQCNAALLGTARRSFFKPVDVGGEWARLSEIRGKLFSVHLHLTEMVHRCLECWCCKEKKTFRDGFHCRNTLIC